MAVTYALRNPPGSLSGRLFFIIIIKNYSGGIVYAYGRCAGITGSCGNNVCGVGSGGGIINL